MFKAGYLPGINDADVTWHRLGLGDPQNPGWIEVPQLDNAQMTALAQRVRDASQVHLKTMQVSDIVRVIDKATARLLDAHDPIRQQLDQMLPLVTGFDAEMVRLNLTSYLHNFRGLQLHRFVAEDFPNPQVLDAFQPRIKGGWTKAYGPDLLVHVWAGNVPALPMWSFVSGLLVKAGSIGKVSRAEPVFATLFAQLLAEVEPRWRDCFAVVWWPSDDVDTPRTGSVTTENAIFSLADVVVAYGGNEALRAIQSHVPVTTRFLPHGHKLSFGMVSASTLTVRKGLHVARQAALDVVRYDQQGCYSPHMLYVQRGGAITPEELAHQLANELASLQHKLPRQALSLEEAEQIRAWRATQEMAALNDSAIRVLGSDTALHTVVFREKTAPLTPGPLNRCVTVVAVDSLEDVIPMVTAQREYLQTVGLATPPEELMHLGEHLGRAGVTRICALGAMTSPEAGWHHDGRFSLLDLVRMVDIEANTEIEAERFTSYES